MHWKVFSAKLDPFCSMQFKCEKKIVATVLGESCLKVNRPCRPGDIYWDYNPGVLSLTDCGLGDFNEILGEYFSSQLQWLMA